MSTLSDSGEKAVSTFSNSVDQTCDLYCYTARSAGQKAVSTLSDSKEKAGLIERYR